MAGEPSRIYEVPCRVRAPAVTVVAEEASASDRVVVDLVDLNRKDHPCAPLFARSWLARLAFRWCWGATASGTVAAARKVA